MAEHWQVTVVQKGKVILTIEANSIAGKESFTVAEEDAIRLAGENLLAFIGAKRSDPKPASP